MNPHGDYHLLLMRVPSQSATTDPKLAHVTPSVRNKAPEPDRPPHSGSGAVPLCSHIFCQREATNGDLCDAHADLMKDLREEYYELQREFEAGW